MKTIPREITIRPVLNGYVCKVGCQTLVFQSRENMINALRDYLERPDAIEEMYRRNSIHKEMLNIGPEVPPPPTQCDCGTQSAVGCDSGPLGIIPVRDDCAKEPERNVR